MSRSACVQQALLALFPLECENEQLGGQPCMFIHQLLVGFGLETVPILKKRHNYPLWGLFSFLQTLVTWI
jgi:hypothetical protein